MDLLITDAVPVHSNNDHVLVTKIGGVCVVPIGDSLMRIVRVDHQKDQRSTLLPVSFANLISPKEDIKRVPVELRKSFYFTL